MPTQFVHRLKPAALLAVVVLAAGLTAATALAASPTVSDSQSAYWTARVDGAGFTPSTPSLTNYALIEIKDSNLRTPLQLTAEPTSKSTCVRAPSGCVEQGGTFHVEVEMKPVKCADRFARAKDVTTGVWTDWVKLGCN